MFTFKGNMHNKAILNYNYTLKRKMSIKKKRAHGFTKFIGEILIPEILAIYGADTTDFYLNYQSFALDALSYACFGKFCANLRT